jgi:hypothetical protein
MPAKTVAAEDLTNARRTYVFDGPTMRLHVSPDDQKGVPRGGEVSLSRDRVIQMLTYGAKFKTTDGATIRTRAQLDALNDAAPTPKSGADTVQGTGTP